VAGTLVTVTENRLYQRLVGPGSLVIMQPGGHKDQSGTGSNTPTAMKAF